MKEVYWIYPDHAPGVAIVARPRGGDWLESDLQRLKHAGIDLVVSLLTVPEAEELGLSQEFESAQAAGVEFRAFPIPDRHIPEQDSRFKEWTEGLADEIRGGRKVGIHCRASIGRASLTAAAILIQLGVDANAALAQIEDARGCAIPDTLEQRRWIIDFESAWKTLNRTPNPLST